MFPQKCRITAIAAKCMVVFDQKFLFIGVTSQMQKLGKTEMVSLFVFQRLHLGYKVPPWGKKLLQQ